MTALGFGVSAARQRLRRARWDGVGWNPALPGEYKVVFVHKAVSQSRVSWRCSSPRLWSCFLQCCNRRAVKRAVRQKLNLQMSRCGEVPLLVLEKRGQNWETTASLPCVDCHPTEELHLILPAVEPNFEDHSTGQRPPNPLGIQLDRPPLLWS